jgi:hypothetical protein
MNCVTLYSPLKTNLSYAYASDYMPFQANGEIITGLFEYNETPYAHTVNDKYINLDPVYIYNIAKATTGAVQHFAVAGQTLDVHAQRNRNELQILSESGKRLSAIGISKQQNPTFQLYITDFEGKILSKTDNQIRIDISTIPKGIYLGTFKVEDQQITKKLIVD